MQLFFYGFLHRIVSFGCFVFSFLALRKKIVVSGFFLRRYLFERARACGHKKVMKRGDHFLQLTGGDRRSMYLAFFTYQPGRYVGAVVVIKLH
ncbi:hypothetical protein CMQ96_23510 [Klebsiella sp. MBT K-1]|nr:hypothetical protein CMQ96_23510 [Klebsiella sp. MBT K-1]